MSTPFDASLITQFTTRTLADAARVVDADPGIADWRKRDVRSAVNRIAAVLNRPPEAIPADLPHLNAALDGVAPPLGVDAKTWANRVSNLRFALDALGCPSMRNLLKTPLAEAWRDLVDGLPKYLKDNLRPFAAFCSAHQISPRQVDDAVVRRYLDALTIGRLFKNPWTSAQSVVRLWNRAREQVPGWPDTALAPLRKKENYALPWDAFHPSFVADAENYFAYLQTDDIFDENAPTRPLAPGSIDARRFHLRFFATTLVRLGVEIQSIRSLRNLVAGDRFQQVCQYLHERAGNRKTITVYEYAYAVRTMAKYWLRWDERRLRPLKQLCSKLKPKRRGMTRKNRDRLAQFDDPEKLAALLLYSVDTMRWIARHDDGSRVIAVEFEIALAVELLLFTLLRIENLASLSLANELVWSGPGQRGSLRIVIDAVRVKNDVDIDIDLPPQVARWVKLFVERFRGRLGDASGPYLFPGDGRPYKRGDTFSRQISDRLRKTKPSLQVNAHLIRHLAGKLLLERHPGAYGTLGRLLAHKSQAEAYRTYSGQEVRAAFAELDSMIYRLRDEHARNRRAKRR